MGDVLLKMLAALSFGPEGCQQQGVHRHTGVMCQGRKAHTKNE